MKSVRILLNYFHRFKILEFGLFTYFILSLIVMFKVSDVGNISDIVNKAINPRIRSLGLFVSCSRPPAPILNKFNQATGQHFWAFYRLPEAANDPEFSDIVREGKA